MFKSRGVIVVEKSAVAEDALIELALDAGADDVGSEGDSYEVLTPPASFESVKDALAKKSITVQAAELGKVASILVPVSERDAEAILKLVEALEDHDDVQKVYANFDVPDEVLARLSR
jgi:transcriptional/translational regulatory protein YebC/TACO1